MFSERMALKTRLEELDAREKRVAKECREEREWIYERIRKLDEQDALFSLHTTAGIKESSVSTEHINEEAKEDFAKTEILPDNVDILKTSLMETIEPMMNGLKEIVMTEKTEKEYLLKSLEASNSVMQQLEETLKSYVKAEKKSNNQTIKKPKKQGNTKNGERGKSGIDYQPLYQTAISILKQHSASIQSVELKKEIENRHGIKIPNMTTFMQLLMKKDERIEKPYRGEYFYKKEGSDNNLFQQEVASTNEEAMEQNNLDKNEQE